MFSKFVPTISFLQVLSVFSLSRNQQTAPLPPSSTFLCLWVPVFNYFFDVLLGQRSKPGSHVFASSLTASNTKRANLTWLPLEIMHRGHTWHDYPWPWVSLTWLLYNLHIWRLRSWFRKFTVLFRPIRKEIVSSKYNNTFKRKFTVWQQDPKIKHCTICYAGLSSYPVVVLLLPFCGRFVFTNGMFTLGKNHFLCSMLLNSFIKSEWSDETGRKK